MACTSDRSGGFVGSGVSVNALCGTGGGEGRGLDGGFGVDVHALGGIGRGEEGRSGNGDGSGGNDDDVLAVTGGGEAHGLDGGRHRFLRRGWRPTPLLIPLRLLGLPHGWRV